MDRFFVPKFVTVLMAFAAGVLAVGFPASQALAQSGGFRDCSAAWSGWSATTHCNLLPITLTFRHKLQPGTYTIQSRIRAGYIAENPAKTFRDNILYFEGFGDSMQNHLPLFETLADHGYRVIAFDYMGQGGSEGSMNDTRINDIPYVGMKVFRTYARDLAAHPKPIILGWSAGALAGYYAATLGIPSRVVLISLPLVTKLSWKTLTSSKFTLKDLTTDQYGGQNPNPHMDPFRPEGPSQAIEFLYNIWRTTSYLKTKSVPASIDGFVLLSGRNDPLIDSPKIDALLNSIAPRFHVLEYKGALHEIDNEVFNTRTQAQADIVNFLDMSGGR